VRQKCNKVREGRKKKGAQVPAQGPELKRKRRTERGKSNVRRGKKEKKKGQVTDAKLVLGSREYESQSNVLEKKGGQKGGKGRAKYTSGETGARPLYERHAGCCCSRQQWCGAYGGEGQENAGASNPKKRKKISGGNNRNKGVLESDLGASGDWALEWVIQSGCVLRTIKKLQGGKKKKKKEGG